MATDFASYLFASMTPEQQNAFIAQNAAQGTIQAPTANYLAGLRPDQVQAYKQYLNDEAARTLATEGYSPSGRARIDQLNATAGSLNDPNNYVGTDYQPGGNASGWNGERQQIQQGRDDATAAATRTQALIDQLRGTGQQTAADNKAQIDKMNALIDAQDPNNAAYEQRLQGLADSLGTSRDTANNLSTSALNNYLTGLSGVNQDISTSLGNLDSTYNSIKAPLQSTVQWGGDLTSQAAQADPQALAAQTAALGMLGATASGALDYTSQASGAYADPKYIAMRDQGLQDLRGVSQGSMDVLPGQIDPKAYGAAMSALSQMGQLTNPAVTDQERFLYEQARQQQETDERGADAAMMSKLRRQGMASGGAALTQGALTDARLSQNRLLSDLAASGAAVARSQDMLKSYGSLGSQLNSEANQLGTSNANRKLQALGLYEQGSETAQQSSFDQEYKRGLAADQASRDNQQTRLQGQVAYGNEANAMQNDAFNRGQAADQMAQYNRTTSLGVDEFNNNFAQRERDALANRTATQTSLHLSGDAQTSNNLSNALNGSLNVANLNYGRDQAVLGAQGGAASVKHNDQQTALNQRLGVGGTAIGVNNTGFGQQATIAGAGAANNQWLGGALIQNDSDLGGYFAAEAARQQAAQSHQDEVNRDNNRGLFGTTVLSPNSVNGKKVPILGFG